MKKLLLLLVLFSIKAYAICNMDIDDEYYKFNLDFVSFKNPKDIISKHINKLTDCKINFTEIKCTEITSKTFPVCVLETEFGYFTVTTDYMNTMHIIYTRWD